MNPVTVLGGGLAGLATAVHLARGGRRVVLHERSRHLGGRAATTRLAGAAVNLGPHALYRAVAAPLLAELGVPVSGHVPPSAGWSLRGGRLHVLPGSPLGIATTTLLGAGEKLALPGWLLRHAPEGTVADWLRDAPPALADLLRSLVRVSSYCHAPDLQDARRAQAQLRAALRGVLYVDGGWGSLVDGLAATAAAAGVELRLGSSVDTLPDGDVVVAGPPSAARALGLPVPELVPVRAATLDLVLRRLPRPDARFVLGADTPVYLSEHGGVASLGGTVLHVARYLGPDETGDVAELEALCDLAQPGWRDEVLDRRFLPALLVAGRVDRPGEHVPDRIGPAWVVGDWVGEEGMLLDRALLSARRVAAALCGVDRRTLAA